MVSITPKYLPPEIDEKKHKRKKRLLLVVFLLLIVSSLTVWFIKQSKNANKKVVYETYPICNFKPQEQQAYFDNREALGYKSFNDYLFYGEELSIYQNTYNRDEPNPLVGQTIQFHDICSDTIHSFLVGNYLDQQVPIYELPEGFYEVLIQSNLDGYRLVSPTIIENQFTTVTREGKRKLIKLMADRSLFTNVYDESLVLDDNELFVEVSETGIDPNIVDVVLDPYGNHADFGPINKGAEFDDFIEANETYRFALDVQKKLEEYGLKVILTRPNQDLIVNTYGDNGRVFAAMNAKAKLMVEFYFEQVEDRNLQGTSVYGSNYVSLNFQESLIKQFKERNLPIFIGSRGQVGAFHNPFLREMDQSNLIRESGGYALGAGEFSDRSARLNTFAINNRFGVHTVSLNLLMVSNPEFKTLWKTNYEAMVEASAFGILDYLGIKR